MQCIKDMRFPGNVESIERRSFSRNRSPYCKSRSKSSTLPRAEAIAELSGSRQRLQERLGVEAKHFAFPYGRFGDCGPRDFELARDAGFSSAATTRKGLLRRGQNAFTLPRNTLNGGDRNLSAVQLHLSGLTGVAAKVTGRV